MKLFDTFITEENKKYIGVIHLDNEISIMGSKSMPFFSLTGFQVGPGLVYLFLKSFAKHETVRNRSLFRRVSIAS